MQLEQYSWKTFDREYPLGTHPGEDAIRMSTERQESSSRQLRAGRRHATGNLASHNTPQPSTHVQQDSNISYDEYGEYQDDEGDVEHAYSRHNDDDDDDAAPRRPKRSSKSKSKRRRREQKHDHHHHNDQRDMDEHGDDGDLHQAPEHRHTSEFRLDDESRFEDGEYLAQDAGFQQLLYESRRKKPKKSHLDALGLQVCLSESMTDIYNLAVDRIDHISPEFQQLFRAAVNPDTVRKNNDGKFELAKNRIGIIPKFDVNGQYGAITASPDLLRRSVYIDYENYKREIEQQENIDREKELQRLQEETERELALIAELEEAQSMAQSCTLSDSQEYVDCQDQHGDYDEHDNADNENDNHHHTYQQALNQSAASLQQSQHAPFSTHPIRSSRNIAQKSQKRHIDLQPYESQPMVSSVQKEEVHQQHDMALYHSNWHDALPGHSTLIAQEREYDMKLPEEQSIMGDVPIYAPWQTTSFVHAPSIDTTPALDSNVMRHNNMSDHYATRAIPEVGVSKMNTSARDHKESSLPSFLHDSQHQQQDMHTSIALNGARPLASTSNFYPSPTMDMNHSHNDHHVTHEPTFSDPIPMPQATDTTTRLIHSLKLSHLPDGDHASAMRHSAPKQQEYISAPSLPPHASSELSPQNDNHHHNHNDNHDHNHNDNLQVSVHVKKDDVRDRKLKKRKNKASKKHHASVTLQNAAPLGSSLFDRDVASYIQSVRYESAMHDQQLTRHYSSVAPDTLDAPSETQNQAPARLNLARHAPLTPDQQLLNLAEDKIRLLPEYPHFNAPIGKTHQQAHTMPNQHASHSNTDKMQMGDHLHSQQYPHTMQQHSHATQQYYQNGTSNSNMLPSPPSPHPMQHVYTPTQSPAQNGLPQHPPHVVPTTPTPKTHASPLSQIIADPQFLALREHMNQQQQGHVTDEQLAALLAALSNLDTTAHRPTLQHAQPPVQDHHLKSNGDTRATAAPNDPMEPTAFTKYFEAIEKSSRQSAYEDYMLKLKHSKMEAELEIDETANEGEIRAANWQLQHQLNREAFVNSKIDSFNKLCSNIFGVNNLLGGIFAWNKNTALPNSPDAKNMMSLEDQLKSLVEKHYKPYWEAQFEKRKYQFSRRQDQSRSLQTFGKQALLAAINTHTQNTMGITSDTLQTAFTSIGIHCLTTLFGKTDEPQSAKQQQSSNPPNTTPPQPVHSPMYSGYDPHIVTETVSAQRPPPFTATATSTNTNTPPANTNTPPSTTPPTSSNDQQSQELNFSDFLEDF